MKMQAVQRNDQEAAKLLWCYEQVLNAHEHYITAFHAIKNGSYYSAWREFERVEIVLHHLEPHFRWEDSDLGLDLVSKHMKQFQSIFPYKWFISPAMLVEQKICSVCGDVVSLRNPCGHRPGEIYEGEMCHRKIQKARIIELSLVQTPGHKYSVVFFGQSEGSGPAQDAYDYSKVHYVADGLRSPYDVWDMRWTKIRHPHSRYDFVDRHEACPCGSDKKYSDCCLPEAGVLRPHLEIIFSVPPPEEQLEILYTAQDARGIYRDLA